MTSASEGESRIECPETDYYYGDEDYQIQKVSNVKAYEDCGNICTLTTTCKFWSWDIEADDQGQECYLYDGRQGGQYNPSYVSGEKGCPSYQRCTSNGGGGGGGGDVTTPAGNGGDSGGGPSLHEQKSKTTAFCLSLFLGFFGVDWFYLAMFNGGYRVAGM